MKRFDESRGLQVGGVFTMVVGVIVVAAALAPAALQLDTVYRAVVTAAPEGSTMTLLGRGSTGVMGAVLFGFGDLIRRLGALIEAPSVDGVRRAIRGAVWAWFILDSGFSVAIGAPLNVLGNLVFLGLLLGPTWARPRAGPTAQPSERSGPSEHPAAR